MRCRAAARLTQPALNQGDDLTTSDFHTDLAQSRVAVAGTVTDRPRASLSSATAEPDASVERLPAAP